MIKKPKNAAQALIRCLENHGVEYIFGHPGGAAIPLFDALYDSKITISSFYKLLRKFNYDIINQKFYHIRPSHELRYGLRIKESKILYKIPVIRELLITGTVFLLNKNSTSIL